MYIANCRAYLRHDRTASTKQLRLSAQHWSIIQTKQRELAVSLGVPRVSRPVALSHILDEYNQNRSTQEK
ncbi:MAG: hypothetical protein CMI01_00355 [Oceanospirillaceae bacterium]|nr:hypothetical protein [Oceanospirillaceae bacterium]